jgi:hypothetical protein
MAELYAARARVAGSEGSQEASYVRELEGFLARHPVDSDRARQHFHQLARSQDSTERFIALQALTGLADSYPDALQDPSDPTLEIYSMAIGDADPTIRIEAARGLLRYDRDRANIGIVSVVAPNLIPLLGHADDKIALPAHSLLQDALKFRSSFRGRQRPQTTAADVQHDRYEVQLQWGKFWFGKDYKLPQPAEDAEAPEPAE